MNDRLNDYLLGLDVARRAKAVSNRCAERLEAVARREHAKFGTVPRTPRRNGEALITLTELSAITGLRSKIVAHALANAGVYAVREPGQRLHGLSERGKRYGMETSKRAAPLWHQRAVLELVHKYVPNTKTL